MTSTPKRPRDTNQLAKMVVDIAGGQIDDTVESGDINPMASLGRSGGLKGGPARAASLSTDERTIIAKKAAAKRWRKV